VSSAADTHTPHAAADGRSAPAGPPTEPGDYGALNAVYLTLFAGVLAATSRRPGAETAIPSREIVPLGVATFALSKVIAREKIGSWAREPFVEQDAEHNPEHPRGRGMRHAIGELMTCTRCVGAWAALALVALRLLSPPAGRIATTVLATSGVNDFLQSAFRLAAERANAAGG
jgi:hypothetical protein